MAEVIFTQEELERIAGNINAMVQGTVKGIKAVPSIIMRAGLYDDEALKYAELYPEFKDLIGKTLEPDWIIRHEGDIYRVNQQTVATETYLPGAEGMDALYKKITFDPETGYEDWQAPQGGHDAYSYGDIVKHNDKLWISTVEGEKTNVWEPGVYGWDEYIGE